MGAGEEHVHPYKHRWPHYGFGNGYDWRAIRRGRQVYSEVFAPCHSLQFAWFRSFSYFMTDAEIKELAAKKIVPNDEPDEDGTYSWRPMKPADQLPFPYQNEREARFANSGALPPDLSNITRSRHDGMNYVYALLQGYKEELPAGHAELRPGQYFNPYFPGGVIGMPPPLSDDMLEYEDGTPATVPQMSKDVVQFLEFIFDPKADEAKKYLLKSYINLGTGMLLLGWLSRRMGRTWYAGTLSFLKKYKH